MQPNLKESPEETDINDVFEDILFSEEKVIEEGYKEGFSQGTAEDTIEGYHLGYHRGAEIGSEIGFYEAFVDHYLHNSPQTSEKLIKNLNHLKQAIDEFPKTNTEHVDILELLDKIRGLYKKLSIQLKIKIDFKKDVLNF